MPLGQRIAHMRPEGCLGIRDPLDELVAAVGPLDLGGNAEAMTPRCVILRPSVSGLTSGRGPGVFASSFVPSPSRLVSS